MNRAALAGAILGALLCMTLLAGTVIAQEKKTIKGIVKHIDLNTNTAVVATFNPKEDVPLFVEDKTTLDKFKDGRIRVDDEVTVKYIVRDGRNVSTYFRKSAGC